MANNPLQFTDAASGNTVTIPEANIIFVASDTLGAMVQYVKETGGSRIKLIVTQTPATIATVSQTFIPVTIIDPNSLSTQVNYVSTTRIGIVDGTGTYVKFDYNVDGSVPRPEFITETLEAFETLRIAKNGDLVYTFDDVSATLNTISLAAVHGDLSTTFAAGVGFTVFGSATADMNEMWVVDSVAFGTKTVITVTGTIPANASETGSVWINA